jgi:hypothetical protein
MLDLRQYSIAPARSRSENSFMKIDPRSEISGVDHELQHLPFAIGKLESPKSSIDSVARNAQERLVSPGNPTTLWIL